MGDISTDLKQNEKRVREMIEGCDDILFRPMKLGKNKEISCFLIYIEVAAGNMMLEDSVIGKMLNHMWEMDESGIQKAIEENSLGVSDTKELVSMDEAMPNTRLFRNNRAKSPSSRTSRLESGVFR